MIEVIAVIKVIAVVKVIAVIKVIAVVKVIVVVEVIAVDPDTGERTPYPALVYEMTRECKREREGEAFGEHYRQACSEAAEEGRVPVNGFAGL